MAYVAGSQLILFFFFSCVDVAFLLGWRGLFADWMSIVRGVFFFSTKYSEFLYHTPDTPGYIYIYIDTTAAVF